MLQNKWKLVLFIVAAPILFTACAKKNEPSVAQTSSNAVAGNLVSEGGNAVHAAPKVQDAVDKSGECRALTKSTLDRLAAEGAENLTVKGFYDKASSQCMQYKRFEYPQGNLFAGALTLELYVGANEDDWLAKCSDISGTCKFGDQELPLSGGQREASVAQTEQYIADLVRTAEEIHVALRPTLAELNIKPRNYLGKQITVTCDVLLFIPSDGILSGLCSAENDPSTLSVDFRGMSEDAAMQFANVCSNGCSGNVTGIFTNDEVENVLSFDSVEVGNFRATK